LTNQNRKKTNKSQAIKSSYEYLYPGGLLTNVLSGVALYLHAHSSAGAMQFAQISDESGWNDEVPYARFDLNFKHTHKHTRAHLTDNLNIHSSAFEDADVEAPNSRHDDQVTV